MARRILRWAAVAVPVAAVALALGYAGSASAAAAVSTGGAAAATAAAAALAHTPAAAGLVVLPTHLAVPLAGLWPVQARMSRLCEQQGARPEPGAGSDGAYTGQSQCDGYRL